MMRSTGFVVSVFAAFTLGGIAACASAQTEQPASRIEQIAVRVNKEAISAFQVDLTMAQTPEIKPEQRDAVGKATLERLIDLSLASQKAREVKLDQNPVMVQALELARNQILAQAYLTQAGKVAGQPAEADAKRYFDANPALFAERRVYQLQELTIAVQPAHVGEVKGKLMAAKTIKEVLSLLDAAQVKYNSTWADLQTNNTVSVTGCAHVVLDQCLHGQVQPEWAFAGGRQPPPLLGDHHQVVQVRIKLC